MNISEKIIQIVKENGPVAKRIHFLILPLILFSGCASTSTFHPYPSQINPFIERIKEDAPIDLKKEFRKKLQTQDKVLYLLEFGRLAQIKGDIYQSLQSFQQAQKMIKEIDQKPIFSASGAIAQSSSILVNDNALPFRPEGYERVMLNLYQAMNYVYQNDLEGAAVEVRKANLEQEQSLRAHENEIQRAKQIAQGGGVSSDIPPSVADTYAKLDTTISQLKNSFQNAYTFYLSGIIYDVSVSNL